MSTRGTTSGMSEAPTQTRTDARRLRSDAAANRERILAAATIAVRRDREKVPMATIADEAGVGIGTLYRHYPTRPALLAALTLRSFHLVLQHARPAALSDQPVAETLEQFFEQTIAARNELILPLHGAAPSSMTGRSSRFRPRSGTSSSRSSPVDAATGPSDQTPPRSTSSSPGRCSPNHSRTQLTGTSSRVGKPDSSSQASLPRPATSRLVTHPSSRCGTGSGCRSVRSAGWLVSTARPSVMSPWWPTMMRRCASSCGGSRGHYPRLWLRTPLGVGPTGLPPASNTASPARTTRSSDFCWVIEPSSSSSSGLPTRHPRQAGTQQISRDKTQRFRRDHVATTPVGPTGTGHHCRRPAHPPTERLTALHSRSQPPRTYGFLQTRPHGSPAALNQAALKPPGEPRAAPLPLQCWVPLSGPQVRTSTSDLIRHALRTRSPYGLAPVHAGAATTLQSPSIHQLSQQVDR